MKVVEPEELRPVAPEEIPRLAADKFELYSSIDPLEPGRKPEQFDGLWVYRHPDGDRSYIAHYTQEPPSADASREHTTLIIDVSKSGGYRGYGRIALLPEGLNQDHNQDAHCVDKPYVTMTYTPESATRQGLARRRLLVMSAASLLIHDRVLYSGWGFTHVGAIMAWEGLVREDLAVRVDEQHPRRPGTKVTRYHMQRAAYAKKSFAQSLRLDNKID